MWRRIAIAPWVLAAGVIVWWLVLVLLAQAGVLFDDMSGPLIIGLLASSAMACLGYRLRSQNWSAKRTKTPDKRSIRWALSTTFIAAAPLLASIASALIAASLGCTVNEHYAKGCFVGPWDLNALVHFLHLSIFAILITWPAALIALVLWAKIVLGSANDAPQEQE